MKTKKARPLNAVSRKTEILIHIVFIAVALTVILPIVLTMIISFTGDSSLMENGYSFFPTAWTLDNWRLVFGNPKFLLGIFNSAFVTVVGTLLSLAVSVPYAYALSRKDFKHRRLFNILAVLPWAFSAGLAPTFVWMKQGLHAFDNYAALILPLLVNPLNLIMLRTAFASTVSQSRLDAAYMDGCGEWRAFWHIALPAAKPAVIASAFFTAAAYYGDFFNSILFVLSREHLTLSNVLRASVISGDDRLYHLNRLLSWNEEKIAVLRRLPQESLTAAYAVLLILPLLIAAPFMNRLLMKGLEMGPVKYFTDGTAEKGLFNRKQKTKNRRRKVRRAAR